MSFRAHAIHNPTSHSIEPSLHARTSIYINQATFELKKDLNGASVIVAWHQKYFIALQIDPFILHTTKPFHTNFYKNLRRLCDAQGVSPIRALDCV